VEARGFCAGAAVAGTGGGLDRKGPFTEGSEVSGAPAGGSAWEGRGVTTVQATTSSGVVSAVKSRANVGEEII
jgi:hypothetical protein